jgi:hypothetical protein
MKVGDRVRLTAMPPLLFAPGVEDEMNIGEELRRCVGGTFTVRGIGTNSTPWYKSNDVELWSLNGKDCRHIEPELLELVESAPPSRKKHAAIP